MQVWPFILIAVGIYATSAIVALMDRKLDRIIQLLEGLQPPAKE